MNKQNVKKIIKHFKKMDPDLFDFTHWLKITADEEELKEWGGQSSSGQRLFMRYGEVPCGTLACFAGEVWIEFAKTQEERDMAPSNFFEYFAGPIDFGAFQDPVFYGKECRKEVDTKDIIKFLEYSLEIGKFPTCLNYNKWLNKNL
jgi:hypothetical protein